MTKSLKWGAIPAVCAAFMGAAVAPATASYPDHPVHLIVGYTPGGGSDIMTRVVGKALSDIWKQPVIVENRPGADGSIAEDYVAHAAPDGYTIIMVTNSHAMPAVGYTRNYDPIKSFAPVSLADSKPMVLMMNPSVPAHSVKELIALAKAKPGQLNYGSSGPATDGAMLMLLLMQRTGTKMTNVRYKGGGETQAALLGGEIQLYFDTAAAGMSEIKAGKLKALAVTSDVRSPVLPEVPTLAEAGDLPGFNETAWNGILAPAGTPKEIVDKISRDVATAMKEPEMQKNLMAQDVRPIGSTPEEFSTLISDESAKLAALFKASEGK